MTSKSHLPNGAMYMRDWRKSLSASSPTYRIGSATLRFHYHYAFMAICFGTLILIFLYYKPLSVSSYADNLSPGSRFAFGTQPFNYNHSYPLSNPISSNGMVTFRIGLIADLDQMSAKPSTKNTWQSYYKKGHLSYSAAQQLITVSFDTDEPIPLVHHYALKGRGMELSELVTFNGRLLTFDDRTGFVYELAPENNRVIPWVVMMDGDGRSSKGFKSEWATVKDDHLYVGSMGKEWTTSDGEFESFDPMWVKVVSTSGHVRETFYLKRNSYLSFFLFIQIYNLNWVENYKSIRSAMGIQWPGYMIHESGMWSNAHKKWFFLPRRCSKER